MDVLAWNDLAAALIADFAALPPPRRNLVWHCFREPAARTPEGSPTQDAFDRLASAARLGPAP